MTDAEIEYEKFMAVLETLDRELELPRRGIRTPGPCVETPAAGQGAQVPRQQELEI